jgi:predicted ATP-grasp superfamily ATP-dependent carboligase
MKHPSQAHDSVLLASASSGGTIAAVRNFGKNRISAQVVSSSRLGAAAWSRYASRSYSAPLEIDHEGFLNRLLAIGKENPGIVLLPTSDETAWMFTAHAEHLGRYFRLYQPSLETIRNILDKKLLADAAVEAGVDVLPSWNPQNSDQLASLATTFSYPLLIKPRTHVQRLRNDKGVVVETPAELAEKYDRFLAREIDQSDPHSRSIDALRPLLQQFAVDGSRRVQSITGFIDRSGKLFVTRRSAKVFQRSQPIGVGICHEALPPSPGLSKMAYDLCRQLNYFGIFEVEFIWFGGRWAMIDFNPRFYNQIGLDIRRGMPLPLFAFLDASGQTKALSEAVAQAQIETEAAFVFCDRFTLHAILLAQLFFLRTPLTDLKHWRAWIRRHAAHCVDVAIDYSDPLPGIVHALSEIYLGLKALPRFVMTTPRKFFPPTGRVRKLPS